MRKMKTGIISTLLAILSISCSSTKQGMNEKAMFLMIYDGSNTGVGNVRVYASKKAEEKRTYLGSSDMRGHFFMVLDEGERYTLTLEKDGYESVSKDFEFKGMSGLHFRIFTVDDLLAQAEEAMDVHNYAKALSFCQRAVTLDKTRKDAAYLLKIAEKYKSKEQTNE